MGCYACLVTGEATESSLPTLLRSELPSAVVDAGIATTVVVVMLAVTGVPPLLIAGGGVAAFLLTVVLHEVVLVVAVLLARLRASVGQTAGETA